MSKQPIYRAVSLGQRELDCFLNIITGEVCKSKTFARVPISSIHPLITLVMDTVFLVEMGHKLSPTSRFNPNERAMCVVAMLLSWRNRHPNSW